MRLLPAFDIFVMTSKFEPYGVALLEAKAAGCSIVATAVNEISEIRNEFFHLAGVGVS